MSALRAPAFILMLPIAAEKLSGATSPLFMTVCTTESATGARNSSIRSSASAGLFLFALCKKPACGSSPHAVIALTVSASKSA